MTTFFGIEQIDPIWAESTVCVGMFDGMHRGHQAVVSTAVSNANAHGRPAIVLTFDRHPAEIVRPDLVPKSLIMLDEKIALFAQIGIDIAVVVCFDKAFSEQSPDVFYDVFLREKLRASCVVVGHDFTFGKNRTGTTEWLHEKIQTIAIPPFEIDGQRVSSSEIRKEIANGNVERAHELLGRPYRLSGIVAAGIGLGKDLGMPTANLNPFQKLVIPKNGIYAGFADTPIGRFASAISVGERPSIANAGFAIEAHLIDYPGNQLYGRTCAFEFVTRIRDEKFFGTTDQLVKQMKDDVQKTMRILESIYE